MLLDIKYIYYFKVFPFNKNRLSVNRVLHFTHFVIKQNSRKEQEHSAKVQHTSNENIK